MGQWLRGTLERWLCDVYNVGRHVRYAVGQGRGRRRWMELPLHFWIPVGKLLSRLFHKTQTR